MVFFFLLLSQLFSIINYMLGKLLQTLKSQKSSKPSQHQIPTSISKQFTSNKLTSSLQHYTLPSNLAALLLQHPQTQISKIQYFTLPELPPLTATILSCPISVFHHLPYGNRKVKQIDLTKHPFPYYLQFMKPLLKLQLPNYNHLLINYYPPGVGIMPHSDGPAYYGKVIVLSLSSYCVINFQDGYMSGQEVEMKGLNQQIKEQGGKVQTREQIKSNKGKSSCARLLLQPNSIHIFQEQAYSKYLHGIQNYKIDTIIINYCPNEKKVVHCNISNYDILKVRHKIEEMIEKCNNDKNECGQVQEGPIRVAKVEGNQQYTHVVQIQRYERISITIRHKCQN